MACSCCGPTPDAGRRQFLTTGLAALGAGAFAATAIAPAPANAQTATAKPVIIDVHHHLAPPRWIAEVVVGHHTGQRPLADWTPAKAIEAMDRDGVATSITSISEPSVWFGDNEAARRLARDCNDYAAKLAADHHGRFGMFATVPLPDVDGSLREIEYALDTLHTDGVCLMTSYQGKYLGDQAFAPVMDELNRRKAVVYTHPVRPDCCRNLVPDVAEPVIELATDTTRTIASVVFSGTVTRCPDIRFIWSHGGGATPFLAQRFINWGRRKDLAARLPNGVLVELQKFYYDTAQVAQPYALASLVKLAPISQIVFGTDYPFISAALHDKGLRDYGFSDADLRKIERDNVVALLPRWRG